MDREQVLNQYNITDEYSEEWIEPKEFEKLNLNEDGELSKYALLRQLVNAGSSSAEASLQDEADPLGSTNSVVAVLQSRGINIDDQAIRGQYLVSSSRFNAKAFLRDVHSNATYTNLVNSLDYLESSIQERSEALRYLVERDYDRFVKSKSLLDSVLDQIHGSGFNHEQGWGLQSMKGLCDEANSKLTVIMKPVIDNQGREARLRAALELIKKNKYLFNLPSTISKHIKNHDHDSLVRDYRRGKDMRYNEDISAETPDYVMQNKKITDRIWREVESIVDDYKQETWKQLSTTGADGNYMSIISKLLELGVEDNPIQEWIECQIQNFSEQAKEKFEKLTVRTNLMRMNLMSLPPSEHSSFILPVKEACKHNEQATLHDSAEVVEMWLTIKRVLDDISTNAEKACLFWKSCNEFLEGTKQKNMPTGYQGESKVHLTFSQHEIDNIRQSGRQMIGLFADNIVQYFDSPAPAPPQFSKRGSSMMMGKHGQNQSNGESFLFLPPYANALSAVKYLSHTLTSLASSFRILSQSNISNQASDSLRNVLSKIRERCITAVCHSWKEDSRKFALLEDWDISPNNKNCTMIPEYFRAYQLAVLEGIRRLIYFTNNDDSERGDNLVIAQPSARLLSHVLHNFLTCNSTILDSLMSLLNDIDDKDVKKTKRHRDSKVSSHDRSIADELTPQEKSVDSKVLLLLSNISEIRNATLPMLYKYFEKSFNVPTRDDQRTLRDSMDELDTKLFDLYTRKKRIALSEEIRQGINGDADHPVDWNTNQQPDRVSPYVYDCLLMLVVVHSRVSEVSATLVPRVITVLNDHLIKQVLNCLREVEHFSDCGLLQAIADVEFINMTMQKYIESDAQNSIHLIYGTLKENSGTELWKNRNGPRPYVQRVLEYASSESSLDFACFHK